MSVSTNKISVNNNLGKNALPVQNFSFGVDGGDDYGPTYQTNFYNGVSIPSGGYVIYVNTFGTITAHAPKDDIECLYYLNKYGANVNNITDALNWASTQNNLVVHSSEYQLSDLPGSGTLISGQWYLHANYADALNNGWITFPDHNSGIGSLNPNEVGQNGSGTMTQIYINVKDSTNNSHSSDLVQLAGHSGTLTLTQGANKVKYTFTNQSFQFGYGSREVYADWYYEGSVLGSITVTTPASGDFNTTDPITIIYTIV